ncbi:hypothetical protein ASE04_07815 [Rhizobium sp. Root708]|nr:hypothetical protein ASE04_07815 [Rhizobium sp. Root708]
MQVVGQDQDAERHHPESENRQKSETAACDKQPADRQSRRARLRQGDTDRAHNDLACRMINAKPLGCLFLRVVVAVSHPQEMGITTMNARRCHFFEKTAWQIVQAFVLAHSHRGER